MCAGRAIAMLRMSSIQSPVVSKAILEAQVSFIRSARIELLVDLLNSCDEGDVK